MDTKPIYVVCGIVGEYEDRYDWQIIAFDNDNDALAMTLVLEGQAKAALARYNSLSSEDEKQAFIDGLANATNRVSDDGHFTIIAHATYAAVPDYFIETVPLFTHK